VAGDEHQVLAGTLAPGDRVDVVANIKLDNGGNAHAARIVLRDLEVLSIASESVTGATTGDEKAVILAVSDTQTQRLFFVMRNSDWTLQLRPVIDPSDSPERLETTATVLTRGIQ
jgi:Flp pilus assembly protein CpaB